MFGYLVILIQNSTKIWIQIFNWNFEMDTPSGILIMPPIGLMKYLKIELFRSAISSLIQEI